MIFLAIGGPQTVGLQQRNIIAQTVARISSLLIARAHPHTYIKTREGLRFFPAMPPPTVSSLFDTANVYSPFMAIRTTLYVE